MLRRVVKIMLAGVGLALLVWIPFSVVFGLAVYPAGDAYGANEGLLIALRNGAFDCYFASLPSSGVEFEAEIRTGPAPTEIFNVIRPSRLGPPWGGNGHTYVIPVWLLAVLCLAWPVTSFVIARRRRRGRGFEVEAVGGNAVSTMDS